MKALITGASSGIGKEMAKYLSKYNFELILCGRNKEELEKLQQELKTNTKIIIIDLADEKKAKELYMLTKNENIDLLINNAGFGLFGDYNTTDLLTELQMIELNIKALHILTRMFLKDMIKKDKGYILNVASSAGLLKGGPLMSTYYATKGYVVDFTLAIKEELRRNKSHVKIGVLCPGPVNTNFNKTAGVKFNISSLSPDYVAKYALDKFIKEEKTLIIPGTKVKLGLFLSRFLPTKTLLKITYNIQRKKKWDTL